MLPVRALLGVRVVSRRQFGMSDADWVHLSHRSIPSESAPWREVAEWVYRVGKAHGLERDRCVLTAEAVIRSYREDGRVPKSPETILKCLFFEQHRYGLDRPPDAEALAYIGALLGAYRFACERLCDVPALLTALHRYVDERRALLGTLHVPVSNRDPLAEFSERLVAALYGGEMAVDRTQKGWDVLASVEGVQEHIQVKYLANPAGTWVNGHVVTAIPGVDRYDLVVFEDLRPLAVLSFRLDRLKALAATLKKRHAGTDTLLQLTQRDITRMITAPAAFCEFGLRVTSLTGHGAHADVG